MTHDPMKSAAADAAATAAAYSARHTYALGWEGGVALVAMTAVDAALDDAIARADAAESRIAVEASRADVAEQRANDRGLEAVVARAQRDAAIARAERANDSAAEARATANAETHRAREAERARDEVGIQYAAAQAEIARMKPVVEAARAFLAVGHGDVTDVCRAMETALRALDTVPGDVLAPVDTEDPTAGLLAASGIDVKGVE